MCAYDKHQELVGIPNKSWSEYTMTQQARAGQIIYLKKSLHLDWLNDSFESYKIKCKKLLL